MSENPNPQSDPNLSDEIRKLGDALGEFFKTAWASQERQDLQRNLEESLKEVGESLSQAAQKFEQSEAGQRLKGEVQSIAQKVESGEVQTRVHNEMLTALQKATAELQKVNIRMSSSGSSSATGQDASSANDQPPENQRIV